MSYRPMSGNIHVYNIELVFDLFCVRFVLVFRVLLTCALFLDAEAF